MRIFRFLIVAGLLIFACGTASADNISIYFNPADSYQGAGSSFQINILADIPESPGLVSYGFNVLWDTSMMQLTSVTGAGSPFDIIGWDSGTPESIAGFLFPTATSPTSVYGSGILLATLNFTCLREGSSTLGIALDPDLFALGLQGFYGPADPSGGFGPPLDFGFTPGSVDQGAVPEPSSLVLLSPILVGLAWWMKRK